MGSERAAALTFGAVAVFAFVLYILVGRRQWFFNDEWDFLANRTAWDIHDLLRPHLGHPSALPVLAYRLLWWTVGLRSYVPYQTMTIVLSLVAAWLVRCVMRRAGVGPWVATAGACVVALFGRGEQNILFGFQITLMGSMVFGLTHLLLADHDGPFDWRDWLGLAAGLAGLLCSNVGVTMVVVVAIATLLRRGWRTALAHTAPLAVLYLAWYFSEAAGSYTTRAVTARSITRFTVETLANIFRATGSNGVVGVLLFALLVYGLSLAWRPLSWREWRRRGAAPTALLIGTVFFVVSTAFGRAGIPGSSERGRYLHLGLIMVMPAIGVAADAIVRKGRVYAIVALAVLLVGVPGNVSYINTYTRAQAHSTALYRTTVLDLPRLPQSRSAPGPFEPLPQISIGWLRAGVASGRIPAPSRVTDTQRDAAALLLAVQSTAPRTKLQGRCRTIAQPTMIDLHDGETLQVLGAEFTIVPPTGPIAGTYSRVYRPYTALTPEAGPVSFRIVPRHGGPRPKVCGPPDALPGESS